MRRPTIAVCALGCLVTLAGTASAQFVVRENVHVAPGTVAEFETLSKSRTARMSEGGVTFARLAAVAEGNGLYRFQTLLDDTFDSVNVWREQIAGLPAGTTPGAAGGIIESIDRSIWLTHADLSYTPDPLRVQNDDIGFVREVLLRPKFGSAPQVSELVGELSDLYRRNNIAGRRVVRELVMGSGGPAFAVVFVARDAQDFYAEQARTQATLGSELQQLVARIGRLCRDVDFSNYLARQDLGYQPGN